MIVSPQIFSEVKPRVPFYSLSRIPEKNSPGGIEMDSPDFNKPISNSSFYSQTQGRSAGAPQKGVMMKCSTLVN